MSISSACIWNTYILSALAWGNMKPQERLSTLIIDKHKGITRTIRQIQLNFSGQAEVCS